MTTVHVVTETGARKYALTGAQQRALFVLARAPEGEPQVVRGAGRSMVVLGRYGLAEPIPGRGWRITAEGEIAASMMVQ